jgi:hypothetical protein
VEEENPFKLPDKRSNVPGLLFLLPALLFFLLLALAVIAVFVCDPPFLDSDPV